MATSINDCAFSERQCQIMKQHEILLDYVELSWYRNNEWHGKSHDRLISHYIRDIRIYIEDRYGDAKPCQEYIDFRKYFMNFVIRWFITLRHKKRMIERFFATYCKFTPSISRPKSEYHQLCRNDINEDDELADASDNESDGNESDDDESDDNESDDNESDDNESDDESENNIINAPPKPIILDTSLSKPNRHIDKLENFRLPYTYGVCSDMLVGFKQKWSCDREKLTEQHISHFQYIVDMVATHTWRPYHIEFVTKFNKKIAEADFAYIYHYISDDNQSLTTLEFCVDLNGRDFMNIRFNLNNTDYLVVMDSGHLHIESNKYTWYMSDGDSGENDRFLYDRLDDDQRYTRRYFTFKDIDFDEIIKCGKGAIKTVHSYFKRGYVKR